MVASHRQQGRSHGYGARGVLAAWLVGLVALPGAALASIATRSLDQGLTATQLASALMGDGVAVTNVSYKGALQAAGFFGGAAASVGIDRGLMLSTGRVSLIAGPNDSPETGFDYSMRQP